MALLPFKPDSELTTDQVRPTPHSTKPTNADRSRGTLGPTPADCPMCLPHTHVLPSHVADLDTVLDLDPVRFSAGLGWQA